MVYSLQMIYQGDVMARPSMAKQRQEEILDALETCILEKGIQATSLEYLAETAKMKRTILRHYIGNRDEIICALSARWSDLYQQQWQETLAWLPENDRVNALIDMLFSARNDQYVKNTMIGEALFGEAKRLDRVKVDIQKNMDDFIQVFVSQLTLDNPKAEHDKIELVAHGIHANYLMAESLLLLEMPSEIEMLKQVSLLLASSFEIQTIK